MFNNYYNNDKSVTYLVSTRFGSIALALIALLLPACNSNNRGDNSDIVNNATVQDVVDSTSQLIGQTVTVRNEVSRIISDGTFTIDDEKLFGNEEILVINASGSPFFVPNDGTEIQITGEVRQFDITSMTREFNLNFDTDTYLTYEGKPAIIARSFALAPKPGEITANPEKYYNKVLAVEAEVDEIRSPITFTLDEDRWFGGKDLLVLRPSSPQPMIKKDEKVVVIGMLRPFVISELDKDYKLTEDGNLRRTLELENRNKPVLIAEQIFPVQP